MQLSISYTRVVPMLAERLQLGGRIIECRNPEELTNEWLEEKLLKRR